MGALGNAAAFVGDDVGRATTPPAVAFTDGGTFAIAVDDGHAAPLPLDVGLIDALDDHDEASLADGAGATGA